MKRKNNSLIPLTFSINTFQTRNEMGGQLCTQNFPISSFQKSLRYKCLFVAGIRRKPFDKICFRANVYLLKVNNGNTRPWCENMFKVNNRHQNEANSIIQLSLLLTLNM